MAANGSKAATGAHLPLVRITRTFAAPRELVFRMWTQPELLERWYAPRRCRLEILRFDFRVGGRFQTRISADGAPDCVCCAEFTEITAPERIVYTLFFCDEQGHFIDAAQAGAAADWPDRTTVTVTLTETAGTTTMVLRQTVAESLAKRTGAHPGWIEMLERLHESLK